MTNTIFSLSRHVIASYPSKSYIGVSSRPLNPKVGDVCYYDDSTGVAVWDGYVWKSANNSSCSVSLTMEAESALDWALQKMNEEHRLRELAKEYPAIQDLLNQKNEIDNKIKVIERLVQEETKIGTN